MVPLFDLKEGDIGEIAEISDKTTTHEGIHQQENCHCRNHRLLDLGFCVGKIVTLLQKHGRGPLLVKVDESRVAIGRVMAGQIKIKNIH